MALRDLSPTFPSIEPFARIQQQYSAKAETQSCQHVEVAIVGAGRAGFHIAQSLGSTGCSVVLFDAEPWAPYDRVMLSNLLSRQVIEKEIYFDLSCLAGKRNFELVKKRAVRINPEAKFVQGADAREIYYDKLVLCLGSSARMPAITGACLRGVYTFRNLGDAKRLIHHASRAKRAVIVGAGYLGLETAFGLRLRGLDCTIVEFQNQLMPGHLESGAAGQLKTTFERLGITTRTGKQIRSIEGNSSHEVVAVSLEGGEMLACDMVVICAGVVPNVELARESGLAVKRGILVDGAMRTSDPDIYAVGECAEHDGRIYGLVGPVIEQANVALEAIRGGKPAYRGSLAASSLKIAGVELFVAGELPHRTDESAKIIAFHDARNSSYRALALKDERLIGAVIFGPWAQIYQLRNAIERGERVDARQLRYFLRTGQLWREGSASSVASWPSDAVICNCRQIRKGIIEAVIAAGATTPDAVCQASGASQLCGSCRPLIEQFFSESAMGRRAPLLGALGIVSLMAMTGAVALIASSPWPTSQTAEGGFRLDRLWTDSLVKQITGFSLVGLTLLVSLLSLRKRASRPLPGSYKTWRLFHASLGVAMIGLLFVHTGLRLGERLNGWLMICLLATLLAGTLAGLAGALDTRLSLFRAGSGGTARRAANWLHILIAWPLPLLLTLHILMVYYF